MDEKQIRVVDIEYKKNLEKIENKDENLVKLFAKLKISFLDQTPENLKALLKEIEDYVGIEKLNK